MSCKRRSTVRRVPALVATTLIAAVAGLVPASSALAHDPIFLTDDQTTPDTGPYLPDGAISWAIYGVFPEAGQTRGFEFDLREGDDLYIGLLIPNLEPELSLPDAELPYAELTLPDGTVRMLEPEIREVFDEQFSQTSYVTLVEIKESAVAGRHSVLIHSRAPSRFVVPVGEREVFFTPAERAVDRPTDFLGIAEPLNIWYQTPPGADPGVTDGTAPEAQVDVEAVEEALDEIAEQEAAEAEAETAATVPDETLPLGPGDDATTSGAAESGMVDDDEAAAEAEDSDDEVAAETEVAEVGSDDVDDDDGSGLAWVVPLVIVLAAAGGAGFWLMRRRSATA